MRALILLLTAVSVACGKPPEQDADTSLSVPDLGTSDLSGDDLEQRCQLQLELLPVDAVDVVIPEDGCTVSVRWPAPTIVEVVASGATLVEGDESEWIAPHLTSMVSVEVIGPGELTVLAHGSPVTAVSRERSLVWTNPEIVDDSSQVGLGRLMAAAAGDGDPGVLFAHWFRRFATTAHSERLGPTQLLEEVEENHGRDPTTWDLDLLAFVVTAVHNRVDLADDRGCGELRVSIASTHPLYQPFHAIFLFVQPAGEGDVSPGGRVHCGATHRRWAKLSELDAASFVSAAGELLDEGISAEHFIMLETVEFVVSPWEWRQWVPTPNPEADPLLPRVLENPPLFQTVDTARLNEDGPLRAEFLEFVEANAEALDARRVLLPQQFRPRSARVNAGVPWVPLRLDGLDPAVLDARPNLRQNIEIVGCPACHATDAEFIQTRPDRTFSPFYDKELDARADYLDAAHRGAAPAVPFGPLQESPLLPP